ncbi:Protein tyrosine kinase domain containing protein [Entamoeba marina]
MWTVAVSSTCFDVDELNMKDEPIAEGAMGKVYIGKYRSVLVSVKQFRWDDSTQEETNTLKKEVVSECELMGKLKNLFIANYMGSVTYLPQISMVIQFFVLGSLGEYLRQPSVDYIKLLIKLKKRMLLDISRGMEFLHENKIMHLDLKPDNILVNSLYFKSLCCVNITNFGTSRFTKKVLKSQDKGLGTPICAAPETYGDEYTFACDVYAFAITTWEIFYQDEPYKENNATYLKILLKIVGNKIVMIDLFFNTNSNNIAHVVDKCSKHKDLDVGVDPEDVKLLINKMKKRMTEQLDELC